MGSYSNFFLSSTTVAGALTGLLFVALSVAPQRMMGDTASVEQQSIAATAFTALVDSLWISLFALRPGNDIPQASLILGLIGLTSTAALIFRLWRARSRERLSRRWPVLLCAIVVLYGFQTSTAFTARSPAAAQSAAATLVLVFFGVGIARSWELLGLRGGGLLDLLVSHARPAARQEPVAGPGDSPGAEPGAGQ